MRIISVAAPGNGSGKTLLVASILRAFAGRLSAVKFTTVFKDGVNCPRTEKACACRELHGRFTVVTDPKTLLMEETDTGRLSQAGARQVLWCLAQPDAHREAWDHVRINLLEPTEGVVTEGNTAIPILRPDLLLMVMSPSIPRARWKPDAWDLARRAEVVMINSFNASADALRTLAEEVAAARNGELPSIQDVSRPLAEWQDPGPLTMLAALMGTLPEPAGD